VGHKRIPADALVEVVLDAGVFEHYAPVHVRHVDGARLRVRGARGWTVEARGAGDGDCGPTSLAFALPVGHAPRLGDHLFVDATRGEGSSHLRAQGVWRVCRVRGSTVSVVHARGAAADPVQVDMARITLLRTTLRFFCSSGLVVESALSELSDVVFVGDYGDDGPAWNLEGSEDPMERHRHLSGGAACDYEGRWTENHAGITVWRGAHLRLGGFVGVSSFDGQGLVSWDGGHVSGRGLASVHHQRRGLYAMNRAGIELAEVVSNANATDGVLADHGGVVALDAPVLVANHGDGASAMFGGELLLRGGASMANGASFVRAKVGGRARVSASTLRSGSEREEHGGDVNDELSEPLLLESLRAQSAARAARVVELPRTLIADGVIRVAVGPTRRFRDLSSALGALSATYVPTDVWVRFVLDPGRHGASGLVVDHPCAGRFHVSGARHRAAGPSGEHRVRAVVGEEGWVLEAGAAQSGDVWLVAESSRSSTLGIWDVASVDAGVVRVRAEGSQPVIGEHLDAVVRPTLLEFECGRGLEIRGVPLGLVTHLVLRARQPCDVPVDGVVVRDGGSLVVAPAVGVQAFHGSGIRAETLSSVYARGVVVQGNSMAGIYASSGASVEAKNARSVGNGGAGFRADSGATLYLSLSTAMRNGASGFVCTDGGHISAAASASLFNGMHGFAARDAVLDSTGRTDGTTTAARGNARYGLFARRGVVAVDRADLSENARGTMLAEHSHLRGP
jgi:hypothetical protein